jgi:hypothetical protein
MPGYQEHLFMGFLSSGIVIALLYFIFHINIIDRDLLTILIIVTLIFSVLPDIDHTSSRISIYLHFSFIASIIVLFTNELNFSFILIAISLAGLELYHWTHAKDNWKHRQFPHTFTFGTLALIVLFLITQSWLSILVGAISFFSHIVIDGHFDEAITQDKKFWKSLMSKVS